MPTYPADSLVLRRLNLGENDRILTLYTREHGKLSAVAKGARRATNRMVGATELFTQSRLLLATGKNLDIVTQCEIRASFPGLRNDLERLARATYLCELLDVFSHERDAGASAECFELTVAALTLLQRDMPYLDGLVHAYELRLLSILGYAPALDHCVFCGNPLERAPYGFSPSLGGTLCNVHRNRSDDAIPLSNEALELLHRLADAPTETLPALHPAPKTAAEVDRVLRWFIRFRAERSLKSADFLDSLRITSQS